MKNLILLGGLFQLFICCEVKYSEKKINDIPPKTFPKQIGLINDYEGVFTKDQNAALKKILYDLKLNEKKEIIIIAVASFAPYNDFQDYIVDLGNNWRIGVENKNTIIIAFSKKNRKVALSIAENTENLSQEKSMKIMSEIIIPEFKEGRYFEGINKGVSSFETLWH